MAALDLLGFIALVLGVAAGYATGRYLWQHHKLALSPWVVIAIIAGGVLVTGRLFGAIGGDTFWKEGFFPFLVGWGAGLSIIRARPPLTSPWWQLWRA